LIPEPAKITCNMRYMRQCQLAGTF
jgi:hypothetical protein